MRCSIVREGPENSLCLLSCSQLLLFGKMNAIEVMTYLGALWTASGGNLWRKRHGVPAVAILNGRIKPMVQVLAWYGCTWQGIMWRTTSSMML